jgi:hypothetical protein
VISFCYHCVTKGIATVGALHMSANVPIISPNSVTNTYHLWSPLGRGYGAHSTGQLIQVDSMKTKLGSQFDYNQCVDKTNYLDQSKIDAYAKQNNINLNRIQIIDDNLTQFSESNTKTKRRK